MKLERALICAVLTLAAAANAGTVWVSLPNPSLCGFDPLAAALRARLPGADIVQGGEAPDGAVRLELARLSDGWSLTLTAPGANPLQRAAFAGRDDCVAVFESAALIADRYLSSIEWNAGAVEVSPLPPPTPPPPLQLLLALGAGAGTGLTGLTPQGELDLGLARGMLMISLDAVYQGFGQRQLSPSTVAISLTQQSAAAQLAAGIRVRGLSAELLGGADLYFVSASPVDPNVHPNPVLHAQLAVFAMPFLGARLGYALALTPRLSLGIRLSFRAHLEAHSFEVEGYTPALVSHLADGDLGLCVSYAFF